MSDNRNFASSSMKIPIFDGTDRTQYQAWADDLFAVLQYHDLDEYVEWDWQGEDIPAKTETDSTRLLNRKEMKKVMAIFVQATKDLPSMLVKKVDTPYNDFSKLKDKYFVKKVQEDFDTLDTE